MLGMHATYCKQSNAGTYLKWSRTRDKKEPPAPRYAKIQPSSLTLGNAGAAWYLIRRLNKQTAGEEAAQDTQAAPDRTSKMRKMSST